MNQPTVPDFDATEPRRAFSAVAAAWRPAGLLYLTAMLGALAVGLWPDAVYPVRDPYRPAALPVLGTLAVAQVGFWLLAYPLIVLHRGGRGGRNRLWPDTIVESLAWTILTVPFYIPAVILGDAAAADAVRTGFYIACLWPFAWACAAWLASESPGRSVIVLMCAIAGIGLPAAWYIAAELLPAVGAHGFLWHAAPATQAWETATARSGSIGLQPAWAAVLWPALAGGVVAVRCIVPRSGSASS